MQTLSTSSWLTKLEQQIFTINQKQATGELVLGNKTTQWRLCFFLGQLIYSVEETHRVRRWQRALKRHCPNWKVENRPVSNHEIWECQLLHYGMAKGELTAAQVKAVVREITEEVVLSITRLGTGNGYWRSCEYQEPKIPFYLTLCPLEVKKIFHQSQNIYQQWRETGLSYLDPQLAPVLTKSASNPAGCSADTFLNLTALFNGRYTMWDISLKTKQPIARVAKLVHYFYKQGVVELENLPDVTPPPLPTQFVDSQDKNQPVIACVDDSPLVGKYLKELLTPLGYRVLYIQDPIEAVAKLTKYKPDLLFLDIVMPKTDGYNLCSFLRKSTPFSNTPVVMLTSWDGVINRVRAKLVGADDFLAKPFETEQVLQLVKKYVAVEADEF
ncbi:MAG TPA: response regulator [Leptolyngbyaceae cyanobacterium]